MTDFGTGSEASEDNDETIRVEVKKEYRKRRAAVSARAPRIRNDNSGIIKNRGRIRVLGIEDVRMDNRKILEIYGSSHNTGRSCHFGQVSLFS